MRVRICTLHNDIKLNTQLVPCCRIAILQRLSVYYFPSFPDKESLKMSIPPPHIYTQLFQRIYGAQFIYRPQSFDWIINTNSALRRINVGRDGVEPPESNDSRFTVCPASIYGISSHVRCLDDSNVYALLQATLDFQSSALPILPRHHATSAGLEPAYPFTSNLRLAIWCVTIPPRRH